jgi:hypothetical protein
MIAVAGGVDPGRKRNEPGSAPPGYNFVRPESAR